MTTTTTTKTTTNLEQFYHKGAADFQELSCEQAAAIQGGAEIQVFTDVGFGGIASNFINYDVPSLVGGPFQDSISSVKVYSGEWVLWSDVNYSGSGIILGPGEHDLTKLNGGVYHDVISSIKINVQ